MVKVCIISGIVIAAWLIYAFIPSKVLKGRYYKREKDSSKTLYLTFDDGPDSKYTEQLLDLLKAHNIRATFFTVVKSAMENESIINRMVREGHVIGVHSYNHMSAMIEGPLKTKLEIEQAQNGLKKLGIDAKLFRSPWGHTNLYQSYLLKKYGYKHVFWDVMAEDWEGKTTSNNIKMKLLHRVGAGDIICLHDARGENEAPSRTIKALGSMLPYWLDQGYEFKVME